MDSIDRMLAERRALNIEADRECKERDALRAKGEEPGALERVRARAIRVARDRRYVAEIDRSAGLVYVAGEVVKLEPFDELMLEYPRAFAVRVRET